MRSKTSLFNGALAKSLLRRFWPLWAAYLVLLILLLPAGLPQTMRYYPFLETHSLDSQVVSRGVSMVFTAFGAGVVAAMVVFHHLYQPRACGLIHSLPMTRGTVFLTAYCTGLAPLLLSQLAVMLLTAAIFVPAGVLGFRALLLWLLLSALETLCFYNFAVFCALLTGSLLVLPVLYLVLNFTAFVVINCVNVLRQRLVYGLIGEGGGFFNLLSPPVGLVQHLGVQAPYETASGLSAEAAAPGAYTLNGLGVLAIYTAVSLVFAALALWLYRRRQLETATDVVAVPVLKPVFKYCLSFGCALVFAALVETSVLYDAAGGWTAAIVALLLLLVGAFIGYFTAEMLMQKTVRVFRGRWKGFVIVCAVLALLIAGIKCDVLGQEKKLPQAEQVDYVWLSGNAELREPENIEAVLRLHRELIARKGELETIDHDQYCDYVYLTYALKDGTSLSRLYYIPAGEQGASLRQQVDAIVNTAEAIRWRVTPDHPVTEQSVYFASVIISGAAYSGESYPDMPADSGLELTLTAAEAVDLYENGILPDLRDGAIARRRLELDEGALRSLSNVEICLELAGSEDGGWWDSQWLTVEMDSVHTIRWLEEHLQIEVRSQYDVNSDPAYLPAVG